MTFAVDELAEAALAEFLAERAPRLAFYSEDRGLVSPPDATHVLVVDPIDGTRPAMAGLESACVAVALAPLGDGEPTMGDVEVGCVHRDQDRRLVSGGSRRRACESTRPVSSRPTTDVEPHVLGLRLPRAPVRQTVEVLAELIDASSVGRRDVRARLAGVRDDPDRRPASSMP